jgi:enamine deaminase RidA (YjgF/YER057c/UK114 family)
MVSPNVPQPCGIESRLEDLGIQLPVAPTPFGSYVEAVQSGNLLFLSGMLPVIDHKPAFVGALGLQLDVNAGRDAARIAALGALASAKDYLGTLDRIKRVVRLGVFMVTSGSPIDQPAVADGASIFFEMYSVKKTWQFARSSASPVFLWASRLNWRSSSNSQSKRYLRIDRYDRPIDSSAFFIPNENAAL